MELSTIIEILKEINIGQLLLIFLGAWFLYGRLIKKMDTRFDKIDKRFEKVDERFEKVDERFEKIEGKIETIIKDLNSLNTKVVVLENKIEVIAKDLNSLNTRTAVLESKMSDINTNVTHLLWHSQAHPHKEAQEE